MKVSVIIPAYNTEKFLPVCLESLAIQTMRDFEVVIVDDCSTDNSVAVAESFSERFGGRMKVIKLDRNTGSGAVPRNVGLEHARGEYIYFVDNDDLLIDDALETLYSFAQDYQADVVYMEKYFMCDEELLPAKLTVGAWCDGVVRDEILVESEDISERVQLFMNTHFCWAPWAKFLRRDFLTDNHINFPHMTIAEDVIWTFKVVCLAKKILRVPEPLYVHRDNKSSIMSRTRTPKETIVFRTSPLIHGLDCLNEFMRGFEFFKQKPDLCLQVLNFFALMQIDSMSNALKSLDATEVYEILLREFSAAGSSQPALISYLLIMSNLYRNELMK